MTNKQKKEIENLNEIVNLLKEELQKRNKNITAILDYKDLESLNTALSLIKEQQEEMQQKDKQIDLMAEYIATLDIEEDICNKTENQNCDKLDFEVCEDCIRQYYKRLVEKEE